MMTIVVGAGLAGLTCAKVLAGEGRRFLMIEEAAQPGGRVVSARTPAGFVLDRGFQVLLDSYPAARRHLDFPALGGGYFESGAMFVGRGRRETLLNPWRCPSAIRGALSSAVIPAADKLRLVRLAARALFASPSACREISGEQLLHRCGFSEEFLVRFARPFFGGVLLDPALQTRADLLLGYLRRFVTGRALLPAGGIGGIARQLLAHLPPDAVRFGARVEELVVKGGRARGVRLAGGETIAADEVVLAVDEPSVCRLLGAGSPRPALSTAVHYFAAERAFYPGAWLCLPPRREQSPVLHAALISNVAAGFAPAGSHLWSVTVVPGHPKASDAQAVAGEVASWFGAEASALRHLSFVQVPYAVPVQLPGAERRRRDLPPGVTMAGDSVCGASIDAVMASGEAAAKKVISRQPLN